MILSHQITKTHGLHAWRRQGLVLRLVTNPLVVQIAKNAGFEVVWIEMEHSTYSITEASVLATATACAGMTPIVRVPYQCGMGYVQQVLDSGALVVVFPHVDNAMEAREAVKMCKFPPLGKRSVWLQQAAIGLQPFPVERIVEEINDNASAVGVMIETAESIKNVDSIASVEGVDMLMVGCIDLSADMGIHGKIHNPEFREALEAVSRACKKYNKVFGLAGNYSDLKFQDWVINTLGVRVFLCQVDSYILVAGARQSIAATMSLDRSKLPN